ncbi:hypothetical protein CF326_g8372, partial [Tilletia indica]
MTRPELLDTLVNTMLARELQDLTTGARRRVDNDPDWIFRRLPIIHRTMDEHFGSAIFRCYLNTACRRQHEGLHLFLEPTYRSHASSASSTSSPATPTSSSSTPATGTATVAVTADEVSEQIEPNYASSWPQPISKAVKESCLQSFREGINLAVGPTCAVCSRRTFNEDLLFTKNHVTCLSIARKSIDLEVLRIVDKDILARPGGHFQYSDSSLNDLALDPAGIHCSESGTRLDICSDCNKSLEHDPPQLPALAMANGNIRGWLPEHLQDITWFEERLCARYLGSACVIRLYDLTSPGAPAERPRVMKGHACAFPLNTVATATKLPWAVGDGEAMVSCLVIGPRQPRLSDLRNVFKVRRQKVEDLLKYLRANFKDYPQFETDEEALNALPEDGVPESILRCVGYNPSEDPRSLFDKETSGVQPHPAMEESTEEDETHGQTFLEHHGLVDINGASISSAERTAGALFNVTGSDRPELVVKYGSAFIKEYDNPALFPGMFPTLFPWGIGGFEQQRQTPLGLAKQGSYLLDLADPAFRRHQSFVFILCNIKQRRAVHNGSTLACRYRDFDRVANVIRNLDPKMVKDIANHLRDGGRMSDLTAEERKIHDLLKKCEVVSAKVPGSKAVMNLARADIRAYVGQFGIFQLFLTLTPSTAHMPVFHVFYGDASVKLDLKAPELPSASVANVRLADDPVAATDTFHFHIAAVFKFLFGYDMRMKRSCADGGVLGHLKAFFLVKEHTMRGQLHGHILIWLEGGINPGDLRNLMKTDTEFRQRYLAFFDDLIVHELPPLAESTGEETSARDIRRQLPPLPSDAGFAATFIREHHLLEPTFDEESSSISPRIRDPTINWHNPTLLVATRHNHDLKSVQSGRSGVAAASYITSYATKSDETPSNQISMINTVYERMAALDETAENVKSLLTKCVMQFGRERQLHAQQVVTYVRDLGDTWHSHTTIAMLSGRMMLAAER